MSTKTCKKCKQEKPMSEYSNGQWKCKTCRKQLRTQTYKEEKVLQERRAEEEKWEAVKRNVHCFAIVKINKKDWVCRLKDVPDHVFQHVNMQIPEEHMEWFQANHHKMIHKAKEDNEETTNDNTNFLSEGVDEKEVEMKAKYTPDGVYDDYELN